MAKKTSYDLSSDFRLAMADWLKVTRSFNADIAELRKFAERFKVPSLGKLVDLERSLEAMTSPPYKKTIEEILKRTAALEKAAQAPQAQAIMPKRRVVGRPIGFKPKK